MSSVPGSTTRPANAWDGRSPQKCPTNLFSPIGKLGFFNQQQSFRVPMIDIAYKAEEDIF
jgi:hypothetical protein